MTHDAAHAIAVALSSATSLIAAAAPQVPMGDEQVIAVSIGAGLIGGLVSTLASDLALSNRELSKRMLASGMAAPAIVAGAITLWVPVPTLFVVFALSGIAGLIAWPISQVLPKLAPSLLKDVLKKWLAGGNEK